MTREITLSNLSKNEKSEIKHQKGAVDLDSLSGGTNRKDSQTTGRENTSKVKSNFSICQTPGCPQRGYDRWIARKWQMENDPSLDDSTEAKEWEKQQIKDKEDELVEDRSDFFHDNQIDKQIEGVQDTEGYGTSRSGMGMESSRQAARDSTNQSDTQSRHSQDQNTAATEWGNTPDNNDTAWSETQAAASGWSSTSENDSTAWGNAQASGTNANEQDTAEATGRGNAAGTNSSTDTEEETTTAATAFEQSVYGDSQTDSKGSTMANSSPKGEDSTETNTEAETESYNNSRSRNRSR